VRSKDTEEEIELPRFAWASAEDPLVERTVEQILAGVSTRSYGRSLEGVGAGIVSRATSKSAASRRFVQATGRKIEEFMARRLESLELVAMMIDALEFAGEPVLVALGIKADGSKEVLGLIHGSSENAAVCRDLLANLVERGLPTDRSLLFVLDGSKALRKAVVDLFGGRALIQRCTLHKRRNVREHLPEERQRAVDAVLRQAYRATSVDKARNLLLNQARTLEEDYPSAAASIREGLDETLTVMRLGLPDQLARTLTTTNPIESVMSTIRTKSRNVRRWRGGKMRLRWAVVGAIEAQKAFRRIKGHRHLVTLANRLREHDAKLDGRILEKAKSATG
jgi:transposase-like protein